MKRIHFIWMGCALPAKYQKRVIKWAKLNRDWTVNLWVLEAFLDPVAELQHWMMMYESANIRIRGIQANQQLIVNQNLIQAFASEVRHAGAEKYRNNWGAASDILRVAILCEEGGLYLDTDVDPGDPLGKLKAPQGFLVHKIKKGSVANDAMYADRKKHNFFQLYAAMLTHGYTQLLQDTLTLQKRRVNEEGEKLQGTVQTSGPGMMENCLYQYFGWNVNDSLAMENGRHANEIYLAESHVKSLEGQYGSDASWIGEQVDDPGAWIAVEAAKVKESGKQGQGLNKRFNRLLGNANKTHRRAQTKASTVMDGLNAL